MSLSEFANSAKRVLNYIEKIHVKPDQPSASETWAEAFGLDTNVAKNDPHEVQEKLNLLRSEVDLIETSMLTTKYSSELYKPYLNRIRKTVTISNISASWSQYKVHLSADTILALRFCSEILIDEVTVPTEELEGILTKIKELKAEIEKGSLPEATYKFILSQILIIEAAIHDYPIKGGQSIKQAFKDGFADLTDKADGLKGNEHVESTSKLGKIWKDLKIVGGEFVEVDKMANTYIRLIEKGQALSDTLLSLPGIGS